jgi:hypothetical protein
MNHEEEPDGLEYESVYGHCVVKNPYLFIPDIELNTDEELLNWRHAIQAFSQNEYEAGDDHPEHFFCKTVDTSNINKTDILNLLDDTSSALSVHYTGGNTACIHGHYKTWGLGINVLSHTIKLWDKFPIYKWLLECAENKILFDIEFLGEVSKRKK